MDNEIERIKREKMRKMVEKMKGGGGMEMETKIEVDDGNFQQLVIEQSKNVPVVVDFWAPWCSPCLMLGPLLEKLAHEYSGKFVLAKLDVNENRENARKYGIMSIPAVKMFKDGKVVDEFVGAVPEPFAKKWLDKNIG
jgi:putative thioredoxin